MKILLSIALSVSSLLAGCVATDDRQGPRVDAMFRETGAAAQGVLTLSRPALVNDINGAYEIHGLGLRVGAALDANGRVISGSSKVLTLEFTDLGDIAILRSDDKDVSLRAELGPEGKVVHALLGAQDGKVNDGFLTFLNDTFESGQYALLYEGPDVVVGRVDLKFRKYSVAVNFRAPRLR